MEKGVLSGTPFFMPGNSGGGKITTAAAFTFWELFKSLVSFTKFVCFTDVPPKGDTQVEKGGGTN